MITSDRQLNAAQEKLDMLKASLDAPAKKGVSKAIVEAAKRQIQELIDELQAEIDDYTRTGQMDPSEIPINTIDDLMVAPIRYRISAHLSVDKFARMVDVSSRQIVRYESQAYQNSSVENLKKILDHLKIRLDGQIEATMVNADE